jgi:hypothetical protein
VQYVDFNNTRTRAGGSVKLDYKLSDRVRFYLNTSYHTMVEHGNQRYVTFATNQGIATRDAAGNLTGTNAFVPGFTDQLSEIRPVANSTVNMQSREAWKDAKTATVTLGGVHRYRTLDIDYDAYQSKSKTNYAASASSITPRAASGSSSMRANAGSFPA